MENTKILICATPENTQKSLLQELQIKNFKVAHCQTTAQCIKEVIKGGVFAVFVDVDASWNLTFSLCRRLKKMNPLFPIIIMLSKDDTTSAVMAAKMRLRFIYEKPIGRERLASIVKSIRERGRYSNGSSKQFLTEGEREVLSLILAGKTTNEISKHMNKSVRMIEEHRKSIMAKFGADNLVDLVDYALSIDLLDTKGYKQSSR